MDETVTKDIRGGNGNGHTSCPACGVNPRVWNVRHTYGIDCETLVFLKWSINKFIELANDRKELNAALKTSVEELEKSASQPPPA